MLQVVAIGQRPLGLGGPAHIAAQPKEAPIEGARRLQAPRREVKLGEIEHRVGIVGRGGERGLQLLRGRRPVVNVSWNDAQAYVRWLNARTGKSYRLLTEAEWEYAARAGTTGRFSNDGGEARLCQVANHLDQSTDSSWRNATCNDGVGKQTAPVGWYAANPFGLHDMHGNVWEWVEDCYRDNLSGQTAAAYTAEGCSYRVIRGGSWGTDPLALHSAFRSNWWLDNRRTEWGFRLARTL